MTTSLQLFGLMPSATTALRNDPCVHRKILGFTTIPPAAAQSKVFSPLSYYSTTIKGASRVSAVFKSRQPPAWHLWTTGPDSDWYRKFTNLFTRLDITRTLPQKPRPQLPTAHFLQFTSLPSSAQFAFLNPVQPTGFFPNAKSPDVRHGVFNNVYGGQTNTSHGEYALHVAVAH